MNPVRILTLAAATLALSGAAQAHTGLHPLGGAEAGLAHPFSGIDHLLTMVAVGLWAGLLGGRARWIVPAAFVAVMAVGAALSAGGIGVPGVEAAIAGSVVITGLLIAARVQIPTVAAAVVVGALALFHGYAHGSEMPAMASPFAYGFGFVVATTLLHGIGLLGAFGWRASSALMRATGSAIAAAGLALAFQL